MRPTPFSRRAIPGDIPLLHVAHCDARHWRIGVYNRLMMPQNTLDALLLASMQGDAPSAARILSANAFARESCSEALALAARNGHAECVKLLIPVSDPKHGGSRALRRAARYGHHECVSLLIPVSDAHAERPSALSLAAEKGHVECVNLLIPEANSQRRCSLALALAAENGHADCVKALIAACDPKTGNSHALRLAAGNGHAECVRLLIPASDPKDNDSQALGWAAECGHAECVSLLIPVSDPKIANSRSLVWAAAHGRLECVKLLIPVSHSLLECPSAFHEAIDAGHPHVAALMISHEPALLALIDPAQCLAKASERKHGDLAAFFLSIIELEALTGQSPARPASPSARL